MHLTDATTTPDICWTVTATDDTIYEVDSQIFTLTLTLVNPSSSDIVLTDPTTTTITVMDDEGILYYVHVHCCVEHFKPHLKSDCWNKIIVKLY